MSKWYNAKFLQICSKEETNSFTCSSFQLIFILGWTIPLIISFLSIYESPSVPSQTLVWETLPSCGITSTSLFISKSTQHFLVCVCEGLRVFLWLLLGECLPEQRSITEPFHLNHLGPGERRERVELVYFAISTENTQHVCVCLHVCLKVCVCVFVSRYCTCNYLYILCCMCERECVCLYVPFCTRCYKLSFVCVCVCVCVHLCGFCLISEGFFW